jgi:hypothetical protein
MPARRWRRGIAALWLGTLAVRVALAAGEALGWPFLAQPLNRWLSHQLGRHVNMGSADAMPSSGKTAFSIRFIGGVRLQSTRIEVGAPAWSTTSHLLRARAAPIAGPRALVRHPTRPREPAAL